MFEKCDEIHCFWSIVALTPSFPPGIVFCDASFAELRADSGIDMTCKESYLSDEEFLKVFEKDRASWSAQPAWRRLLQKKEVGLW